MKKYVALLISLTAFTIILFSTNMISFASQTTDIPKTRLLTTNAYYEFDAETKTLTISGSGSTPDLENTSSGSKAQPWFSWKTDGSIEKIVVEEGITTIGKNFFRGMAVADIELPSTIVRLGSYALAENSRLEHINIENVTSISNNAFSSCTGLVDIFIPSVTTYIGTNSFENCKALENVEFGKMSMAITISKSAFLKCPALKSVDVPRYAIVSKFAFGHKSESTGALYEDFTMNVYSDSSAYTFAKNSFVNHNLLTDMVICEGDELNCEYYYTESTDSNGNVRIDTNLDEKISYYFTPNADGLYTFYSTGDDSIDVDCTLTACVDNVDINEKFTDNSDVDLNFTIVKMLRAGETYCFTVESVKKIGDYTLHLFPIGLESVSVDWDFTFPAHYFPDGEINVTYFINSMSVDFHYASGYVYHMPFEEGASYLSRELHYAGVLDNKVSCGDNYDYITVGDERFDFCIHIEHSYVSEVIEPTIKLEGCTLYTCELCGDYYKTDFVDYLGTDVHGRLKLLADTDGNIIEDSFVAYAKIYDNEGELVGESDENGFFNVKAAYEYLTFEMPDGTPRTVEIENGRSNLGDIAILGYDFNCDGYVNAKDFAVLMKLRGEYESDDYLLKGYDLNKNGVIEPEDWEYARNFYVYGKLNESIYDN